MRLAGKAAIITGAGGGIGAATAQLFVKEGARVLAVDRDADALTHAGSDVDTLAADITSPADCERLVAHALARFGGVHVLVNNAAVRDTETIAGSNAAAWSHVLETNVIGSINCTRAALPVLRAARGASVVFVSSCYGVRGRKGFAAYDASKAALIAAARNLAAEEAEHAVRANTVCPGGTITPFTAGRARARGRTEADMRADRKADTLLGRWAEPIEIAYPILWLASDEASYVNGATIMVDGGAP